MQRIKQRTDKAIAQAARRATRHNARAARIYPKLEDRKTAQTAYQRRFIKKTAAQAHWEKWNMGPLAPTRDLDDDDMEGFSHRDLVAPMVKRRRLEAEEKEKERKMRGRKNSEMVLGRRPIEQTFRVGDRVCCIESESQEGKRGDTGKIGVVTDVSRAGKGVCTVELLQTNRPTNTNSNTSATYYTRQISMPNLRPVKTLYDPSTNEPLEDVIIGLPDRLRHKAKARKPNLDYELSPAAYAHEQKTQRLAKEREEAEQEKQQKEEEEKKQRKEPDKRDMDKDYDIDTLRYEVDERTWTPSLLREPMPGRVIDELRGKYSKFRTRHEADFVARIEAREKAKMEKQEWAQKTVLVDPLRELSLKERAARPVPRDLPPDDLLEKIGRKMAERGVRVAGNGAVDEGGADAGEKNVGVEAAEADAELRDQIERGRQGGYWPVKGWKEKQRRILPASLLVDTGDSSDPAEITNQEARS